LRSALTAAVWAAVLIGLVAGLLPRSPIRSPALAAGALLAALGLLTAASMGWGTDDGAAFGEVVRVGGYLGLFVLVVCLSAAGDARAWLAGLALGIAAVGILALGSRLIPALPGGNGDIAELLPAARGRLSYPIGDWNVTAFVLAIGVVLLSWLGSEASERTGRAAATAAIPVLGLAMYLTSARGGVLTAAVGLAVLVAFSAARSRLLAGFALGAIGAAILIALAKGRTDLLDGLSTGTAHSQGRLLAFATVMVAGLVGFARYGLDDAIGRIRVSRNAGLGALAAAAVGALVLVIAIGPVDKYNEFKAPPADTGQENAPGFVASHFSSASGSGRYQFWSVAVNAFEDQPVHGIGASGYEAYWTRHAPIARAVRDAHSLYLETLAELGPLGLALVVSFLAAGMLAGFRMRDSQRRPEIAAAMAVLIAGAVGAGIDVIWEVPAAFGLVVVAVALLTGPASAADRPPPAAGPGRSRYGWGLAALVVGWLALLIAADSFLTARSLERSREAVVSHDYVQAANSAHDAIALEPWAAEPRLQLALVHESAGALALAGREVVAATDRAPNDWQGWLARARIATRAGDIALARTALARARSLNPKAPFLAPAP
jgi:hypothetical protein